MRNDGTKGDPADIPSAVKFGNTTDGYDCSGTIIGGRMYVILSVIPEPGSASMLILCGMTLGFRRARRAA